MPIHKTRGQTAFEYLMIIGGSVLIAAIAMVVVQSSAGQANVAIAGQTHTYIGFIQNIASSAPTYVASYPTSTPTPTPSPTP